MRERWGGVERGIWEKWEEGERGMRDRWGAVVESESVKEGRMG